MPSLDEQVSIEFRVYCQCGNEMDASTARTPRFDHVVTVDPCDKCIATAKREARDEGYEAGYQAGQRDAE